VSLTIIVHNAKKRRKNEEKEKEKKEKKIGIDNPDNYST